MNTSLRWATRTLRAAGWAPLLVFGLHLVLSRGFAVYAVFPELDIPIHFLGGVAIASFFAAALSAEEARVFLGPMSELGQQAFALTAVFAAAMTWEFAEWTTDRLGVSHAQLGLDDTLLDMAFGVVGGAVCLGVRRRAASGDDRALSPTVLRSPSHPAAPNEP